MLRLEFTNPRGAPLMLGPFPELEIDGARVIVERNVIARHVGHHWSVAQHGDYVRLECGYAVIITFESEFKDRVSEPFGPYASFSSVDGVLFAAREVFAFHDATHGDWYSQKLQSHWRRLMIRPA